MEEPYHADHDPDHDVHHLDPILCTFLPLWGVVQETYHADHELQ